MCDRGNPCARRKRARPQGARQDLEHWEEASTKRVLAGILAGVRGELGELLGRDTE